MLLQGAVSKSSLWKNLDKNNSVSSYKCHSGGRRWKDVIVINSVPVSFSHSYCIFSHNTALLWNVLVYRYFPAIKCVMIPFPLLNLVIFNFWHYKYSVSWCGSLSSSLELSECPRTRCLFFPQIGDIFCCHYFFTVFSISRLMPLYILLWNLLFSFNMLGISFCTNKYCCTFSFGDSDMYLSY